MAGNAFSQLDGTGIFASEALGSWTVQDNAFLGPIGGDGIAIEGFQGDAMTIAGNDLSGVSLVGIRLARSQTTISNNQISGTGDQGIHAESFLSANDTLSLTGNTVSGALESAFVFVGHGG